MKLYQKLSQVLAASHAANAANNTEWIANHSETIDRLCQTFMPSGSGFDAGTTLDVNRSSAEKLIFDSAYHHMDANGSYDGWSDLTITVKPSLQFGFDIKITGLRRKNRHDLDYMMDTFYEALNTETTKGA